MYIVVLVTAKDVSEAKKVSEALLKKRLIACANIVKEVESLFWWKGKIDRASEVLLILKTKEEVLDQVIKEVKANHSYDVCEVIALPVVGGNEDYLKWVGETVE